MTYPVSRATLHPLCKGSLSFPIFSHPPPSSNVIKMPSYSNNSKEEMPSDCMMLSGMRAFGAKRASGQQNLVDWAKPYLLSDRRRVLSRVMDQRLEGQYPSKGAVQAAQLILKCVGVGSDPRRRPSMSEVVETLEQIQAIKHKPQQPKNNPRRPTDHNHAHHRAHLFCLGDA